MTNVSNSLLNVAIPRDCMTDAVNPSLDPSVMLALSQKTPPPGPTVLAANVVCPDPKRPLSIIEGLAVRDNGGFIEPTGVPMVPPTLCVGRKVSPVYGYPPPGWVRLLGCVVVANCSGSL